jgi:hypothetical protein
MGYIVLLISINENIKMGLMLCSYKCFSLFELGLSLFPDLHIVPGFGS